jgi:hypothetical protein
MKKTLLFVFLIVSFSGKAQTLVQSVNSGSVISTSSSVSVGEIVVVPVNPNQSSSGLIGILAQNQQSLEVPELEIAQNFVVFPNPTISKIFFKTNAHLFGEKVFVYNNVGQLVVSKRVSDDNSIDLADLSQGIYLITFSDKKINTFKIIKH